MLEILQKLVEEDWIAVEMARRKKAFHNQEKWDTIKLWGLLDYIDIKEYLEDGRLINHLNYKPENQTYWVIPSKEYWETSIYPIVEKFTAEELQKTFR